MKCLKTVLTVALIWILASCVTIQAKAMPSYSENQTCEVVFLLDTSSSMNKQDKERLAVDAILQAACSLPSGYSTGLVAYNTKVQAVLSLETDMGQIETVLNSIQYSGYTNAGEGLSQAVDLFSEAPDVQRHIIMLSDGEIDMPSSDAREASRSLYAQAVELAKEKGIKICIIAVGNELNNPKMHIFDGAEQTDGAIYWEGQSGTLSQIMNRIVSDRLAFSRSPIGVTDANGGAVAVEVPTGTDRMKLLITSDNGLGAVTADYQAEKGQVTTGKCFAVLDMERPAQGSAKIFFQAPDTSGVQAYLVTEFIAKPRLTVTYRGEEIPRTPKEIKKNVPPQYKHYADVSIELEDTGGDHDNIWQSRSLNGYEITYMLNGKTFRGTIQDGRVQTTVPADEINAVEVSIDTRSLEGIYHMNQPVTVEIMKYPDPEFVPVPDYRPLWGILGTLAVVLFLILGLWIRKKNTTLIYVAQPTAAKEPARKMETKACSYTGKFNLYVVRTADGRDVPPQTYRLFGRNNKRMTLEQILSSCKIKLGKIGAEDISFYPGPDHSVIVMDQSERCTALRGMEILKKGVGYPIFYGDKVTVTFEDESTEMELHYKNLKPSEREG